MNYVFCFLGGLCIGVVLRWNADRRKLTVQQLNRAMMHARWDGPFDAQKCVDELNRNLEG